MGKNPGGRPTDYCDEVAEKICAAIATHAMGYKRLHKLYPELPCEETLLTWIGKYPKFLGQYLEAKRTQAHLLLDRTLDIACRDEEEDDTLLKINRDKLKIDTFKFTAARLNPHTYGEKKEIRNETNMNLKLSEETQEIKNIRDQYKRDI